MARDLSANNAKENSIPQGYYTVTPWIIARGAKQLIDFLEKAFDARETPGTRFHNPDGTIGHAEIRIGDSVVMLFDSRPEWPDTPGFLRLYVADADEVYQRALKAGARSVTEVAEHVFGDRIGRVCDPCGNIWWIQSHIEDVKPDEMARRMGRQNKYADAMREAQASLDRELAHRGSRSG